ncbi:class I histocompatibility antigen, Gogo-C*0101/C*0102 alpha chain [Labeo rohita]|uniref:class I histocompatibility antigen, Gogo-C*0101/C*0102 alpha chain n=1 Tax=Labeo rohita TaxID=84645 RepID=UPI0021E23045|nr:class I histocompatibility antigen, Gogo-C*0101/C*0102 alpha chain [Labeo rohita]
MYFATYIIGQTPFPEFTVVGMVDDIQVRYYDSVTERAASHSNSDSKHYDEEQNDDMVIFRDMYYNLKDRAHYLKSNLNLSDGVHVHQRLAGCELLDNDKPGLIYSWDAFNGQIKEWATFDTETKIFQINFSLIRAWDQQKRIYVNFLYDNIYHPICLKMLRRNLHTKKSSILQKVKPTVRLLKKVLTASHEVQITCLVTGFYPRHINLTLVRDGQPAVGKIMGGDLLPNGDGTYQIRKSLVISVKELHDRHNYCCAINHLSLDNTLDIMFDLEETDVGLYTLLVTCTCLAVLICVSLIITALITRKRKSHAAGSDSRMSLSDYSPTPTQDT